MIQKEVIMLFSYDHWILPELFESMPCSLIAIFCVMSPCSVVGFYKYFGEYSASIFSSVMKMKAAGSPIGLAIPSLQPQNYMLK
jgi:hypothetical protein